MHHHFFYIGVDLHLTSPQPDTSQHCQTTVHHVVCLSHSDTAFKINVDSCFAMLSLVAGAAR